MSTMVGFKPLNRSAKVGIGLKDVITGKTTWVNVDNPRQARDLARHTTLGQFVETQPARYQVDTAQVTQGGIVTPRTASLTLDISAAWLSSSNCDTISMASSSA